MALILLIDTSAEQGLVALSADGRVIAQQSLPEARRQAAVLQPVIAEVVAAGGKNMGDLEAVSVVSGPGSYTGLRVGLAAAKGLCFALDIPLIMPDRLLLLALSGAEDRGEALLWVLVPARTGEWFAGCYQQGTEVDRPRHWEEDPLKTAILASGASIIYGPTDMIEMEKNIFNNINNFYATSVEPDVHVFSKESERRYVNNITDSITMSAPLYLKPAFVTIPTVKKG